MGNDQASPYRSGGKSLQIDCAGELVFLDQMRQSKGRWFFQRPFLLFYMGGVWGSGKNSGVIFEEIAELVSAQTGVKRAALSWHSDLVDDLKIVGDDGHELFEMLTGRYESVDWSELNTGVIFGNEPHGSLPLLPWHLKNNCEMYESRTCRISDIVRAVETGKWPDSPLVLRSKKARTMLYARSWVYFGIVLAMGMLVIGIFLYDLIYEV